MRLRVVSDGTILGSRVVHAETGEPVHGVVGVTWRLGPGDWIAHVTIELAGDECAVDLVGETDADRS